MSGCYGGAHCHCQHHYGPGQYGPPHGGWGHHPSYYWVDPMPSAPLPHDAFRGGHDVDRDPLYVGRAYHEGEWIPAKICFRKRVAYVPWNGKEHMKHTYQVLCGRGLRWVPSSGGRIEHGAVEGGRTKTNEPLYIGRVNIRNSQTIGKIHPTHRTCYIPFEGKEMGFPNYEMLVHY